MSQLLFYSTTSSTTTTIYIYTKTGRMMREEGELYRVQCGREGTLQEAACIKGKTTDAGFGAGEKGL